jgi:cytochrome c-type biogenesis protein CcmH/NrfF
MQVRTALVACSMVIMCWCAHPGAAHGQVSVDTSSVRGYDDTEAQRLFGGLMSPFCPGLTLATCPSPGAHSLRWDIRQRLSRGETPRSVRASYAAVWGEQIRGAPRLRDWGVVLWVTPGVLLFLGAFALALWLRVQRRASDATETQDAALAGAPAPDDPALRKRLEEELAAFDNDG